MAKLIKAKVCNDGDEVRIINSNRLSLRYQRIVERIAGKRGVVIDTEEVIDGQYEHTIFVESVGEVILPSYLLQPTGKKYDIKEVKKLIN